MTSDTLQQAIDLLDYTQDWITLGALSPQIAAQQVTAFKLANSDKNTEHYRCVVLRQFLQDKDAFTDTEFATLRRIAKSELTKALHEHVYHELCVFSGLSDIQFETICADHSSSSFNHVKKRRRLQRAILANPTETNIQQAIASDRSMLQRWLIDLDLLQITHYEQLSQIGASKAIRNMAKVYLRSKPKHSNK